MIIIKLCSLHSNSYAIVFVFYIEHTKIENELQHKVTLIVRKYDLRIFVKYKTQKVTQTL